MEENISTFAGITGATADVARGFLEITSNDLERAIQLYFENPDLVSSVGAGVSGTGNTAASRQSATTTRHRVGTEDAEGVIHIPSDDDDDIMQIDDDDDDQNFLDDSAGAGRVAARAQEEEDAAMAKRLQEELYQGGGGSSSGGGPEDVRAPIARTTETLVGPDPSWGGTDDGGAMEAAFLDQLRRRRNLPPRTGGPFGQRIWGDGNLPSPSSAENNSHARRLEDLFRPPYDLMARLTWDEARTLGKEDKKWILVNLQDMSDFNCQALNRDIWKDQAIKELISENFVFLQYDKEHPDAEDYINFYFHNREHENPDNYPHVSIIDPRTGEQVKIWSGRPFPSSIEFHAELAEFLDRYSLAANSKNPVAKTSAPKPKSVNVDRMTEDEMLEMALKNSLASRGDGGLSSGSGSTPNIVDPDSLTKPAELNSDDKGKEAEMPAEKSLFAQISSDKPHTEPANDPASTTRIQFRHATGRVIRRFKLDDSIRTIFEWLKAEPLQGKEGIEFELKKMPQGQDLIESLDATIVDSGLKQGTVMIEFIED